MYSKIISSLDSLISQEPTKENSQKVLDLIKTTYPSIETTKIKIRNFPKLIVLKINDAFTISPIMTSSDDLALIIDSPTPPEKQIISYFLPQEGTHNRTVFALTIEDLDSPNLIFQHFAEDHEDNLILNYTYLHYIKTFYMTLQEIENTLH